jgi:hypothetical protein
MAICANRDLILPRLGRTSNWTVPLGQLISISRSIEKLVTEKALALRLAEKSRNLRGRTRAVEPSANRLEPFDDSFRHWSP